MNIIPATGERALIVGQTGSGKTLFAFWMIANYLPDGIIYDTKIEPKFASLPNSKIVTKWADVKKLWEKKEDTRFIVFRPSVRDTLDPEVLDNYLELHYQFFRHSLAYIDEVYQFHNNSRPGPGLLSLLTRGRSRGITTIMSTQRPTGLSRFAWSESQKFYIFKLQDMRDRKTVEAIIPNFSDLPIAPKYHAYYYDFDLEAPLLLSPVTLDGTVFAEYIDPSESRHRWV